MLRSSEPLPVLMWIYGGSLTAGSNAYYEYGPMRWIDQGNVQGATQSLNKQLLSLLRWMDG